MNGMEMLMNTVLKSVGFTREQLDEGIVKGKAELAKLDARLTTVEHNIGEILAILRKEPGNATDVAVREIGNG